MNCFDIGAGGSAFWWKELLLKLCILFQKYIRISVLGVDLVANLLSGAFLVLILVAFLILGALLILDTVI